MMLEALPENFGLYYSVELYTLHEDFKLGWEWLRAADAAVAYYSIELITAVKSFLMLQALPVNIELRLKCLTATL